MGILSKYKEEHPELAKSAPKGDSKESFNLPVKCMGYEGEFLLGLRLDTQEEVKIRLRPIEQNPNSRFKRIEITEFANPKSKHYATPGQNIFVAETCYHEKDNVFNSRWIKTISEDPMKTAVHIFNASYISIKKNDGNNENEIIFLRVVYPDKAKIVNSVDELESTLAGFLNPRTEGSNPFAYIRITDTTDNEVEVIDVLPKRVERENMGKRCVEGSISASEFINSDDSRMVRDLLENESEVINVEVIPAAVIYPGSATKENMVNSHPNAKKVLEESFLIKAKTGEEENSTPQQGYLKCILATRKHADGTSYFTFVKPIHLFKEPMSVKDIK